jgi:hypothetical protein
MSFSLRSVAAGLVLITASLLSGCGGGSGKPAPGMGCSLTSQCAAGLICTFGFCHDQCEKDVDCTPGMCVKSTAVGDAGGVLNVCQLATETQCYYNSMCQTPLVCGRDEKCRNQCLSDVDCVTGQVCTSSGVCADKSQIVAGTNDVTLVLTGRDGGADAFASGTAGTGVLGTGGAAGGASSGTGGSGGGTSTGTGGAAGAAGSTGKAGSTGTTGTGGAAGAPGSCSPACGIGKQCVSGSCQDCGASAEVCCGGSTPCGSNLVCSSANMCTCGAVSQPCCGGTSCSPGLSCLNGVCSCGGAGQNCCTGSTGKTCSTGLMCGGLKCGCTQACDQSAAMKTDGSIWVSNTPVTNIDASLFKAAQFSYNGTFACGVKTDGSVWCWGNNTYGSLGNGDLTVTSSTYPLQVATDASGTALTGVTNVQVGDSGYTACAITTGGALWCWGYGTYGQLGTGFKNSSPFAVKVVDATSTQFTGATQLAVSLYHACALKSDSTLWCWGDNSEGQIGVGSSATTIPNPTQVTALFSMVSSVATTDTYYYDTCASTMDGSVYCWGGNGYGELGNGLMSGMALVPSQVLTAAATPLGGVASVIDWSSAYKMCGLKSDGTMWCWGTTADLYAMPLTDNTSAQVTGITVTGRSCYLDNGDLLWVNGAKSGYQITCN